jgi:type II secretory pathway pseudopilin PulG
MCPAKRGQQSDRGETLLELIVAVAVLGVCAVAIGAGIALSVHTSAVHRRQALADSWLHDAAETLQTKYDSSCTPNYVNSLPPDPDASLATNAFGTPSITVTFWDQNTLAFDLPTCPSDPSTHLPQDPGAQLISIQLRAPDGSVKEALSFVLRRSS